jgi:MFS family permease
MICGLTTSFRQLFIARLGVGVGEAGLSPAAISLVSDYFLPQQRAWPLAFLSIGATAGAGFALMFGGAMVHAIGASERMVLPLLGTVPGWQAVLLLLGAIGVLFSGIFWSVREPERRERLAVLVRRPTARQSDLKHVCSRARPGFPSVPRHPVAFARLVCSST